jgi:hypothetical protein
MVRHAAKPVSGMNCCKLKSVQVRFPAPPAPLSAWSKMGTMSEPMAVWRNPTASIATVASVNLPQCGLR